MSPSKLKIDLDEIEVGEITVYVDSTGKQRINALEVDAEAILEQIGYEDIKEYLGEENV